MTAVKDKAQTFVDLQPTNKQKISMKYDLFDVKIFETMNKIVYYVNLSMTHDENDQIPQELVNFLVKSDTSSSIASVKYFVVEKLPCIRGHGDFRFVFLSC